MDESLKDDPPDYEENFNPAGGEDVAAKHAEMRARCPVAHVAANGAHFWALTRHEDVLRAARDPVVFANGKRPRFAGRRPPLESDPPEHAEWRKLMTPFFAPRYIESFEPVSRQITGDLVGPLIAAGGGDVTHDLARPLPPQVLLSFLGQPKEDWAPIKAWCEDAYFDRSSDPQDRKIFATSNDALWDYSRKAVGERRKTPRDPERDLITALLAGTKERGTEGEELVAGVIRLLLAAGHDSTTSAMSICLHYLARHPEDQARLRAEPALIRPAIEEILRFETPVIAMPRMVAQDVEIGGRELKAGDRAMLYFASANRDGSAFAEPDRCLIDRKPNPHLAFGLGIHACIGAPLARQEIRVALEELLARSSEFGLAGPVTHEFWHPYGVRQLPLWIKPRSG